MNNERGYADEELVEDCTVAKCERQVKVETYSVPTLPKGAID